jgi:hypothetical protein
MSLDVSLTRKFHVSYDGGKTLIEKEESVFEANITHNLGSMAEEAGIYKACWRPEEINAKTAKDITPILEKGYKEMLKDPERFKKFDSDNGWGLYIHFLPWVKEYLEACKENPEAEISAWR